MMLLNIATIRQPYLGHRRTKTEHLSSYAHVVNTTAKQVISRRGKNKNVFKMSKDEKCTCKACENTVFHCQICKFVGFLLPSSSWLLKFPWYQKKSDAHVCKQILASNFFWYSNLPTTEQKHPLSHQPIRLCLNINNNRWRHRSISSLLSPFIDIQLVFQAGYFYFGTTKWIILCSAIVFPRTQPFVCFFFSQ